MNLIEILEKSKDYFLEHPRVFAPATFLLVDQFGQFFFDTPSLTESKEQITDWVNIYYDYYNYHVERDMVGEYFDSIKSELPGDIGYVLYFPFIYYLSVKLNRVMGSFHTENFKPLCNLLKIYYSYWWGDRDKQRLKEELQESLNLKKTKRSLFSLGSIHQEEGDIETALDYFKEGIDLESSGYFGSGLGDLGFSKNNPVRWLMNWFASVVSGFEIDIEKIEREPENTSYHLSRISSLYVEEDLEDFKHAVTVSTSVNKTSPEIRFVYALMSDDLSENRLAEEMWDKGINLLLREGAEFEKIADSRNEVLEFKGREFFRKLLVFKRGEDDLNLRKEFIINSLLYDGLSEIGEGSRIVRPLGFFRSFQEDRFYEVTRREDEPNLASLVEQGHDVSKHLEETMKSLGLVHAIGLNHLREGQEPYVESRGGRVKIPRYDYGYEIHRRLTNRFGINDKGARFMDLYLQYVEDFEQLDFLLLGDFYSTNALRQGIIVDFESASIGNPSLDQACMIESCGEEYAARFEYFIKTYYDSLIGNADVRISLDEITSKYFSLDRVHCLMCDVGSKENQGKTEAARRNVQRVKTYLKDMDGKLGDAFTDYIHSTKPQLVS